MGKLNVMKNHLNFKYFRYFGALLVIVSFFVWVLPIIEIQSNEVMIEYAQDYSLGIEEIWAYEGALKWWKNVYATTIIPLIGTLTTFGIVLIMTPFLFQLSQKMFSKTAKNRSGSITLDRFFQSRDDGESTCS